MPSLPIISYGYVQFMDNNDLPHDPLQPADLVWIDVEYDQLDTAQATILEIAGIITDRQLHPIGDPFAMTCRPKGFELEAMSPKAYKLHTANGLLAEVFASRDDEAGLEQNFLAWLKSITASNPVIHCGYYLQADREILHKRMPQILDRLGFRQLDLRSLEEAADAWSIKGRYARPKRRTHRALDDVEDAITLAKWYRERFQQ